MILIDLFEVALAPLYHGTSFQAAKAILDDGGFLLLTGHLINGKPTKGLSATRSPRLAFLDYDPDKSSYQKWDEIKAFNVIFVFNTDVLKHHFKVMPVDFYKGREKSKFNDLNRHSDRRAESEEFIIIPNGKKLPLRDFVQKIIYFSASNPNSEDDPEVDDVLTFKTKALRYNIPVVIKDTLFGWESKSRPWNQDLWKSMVKHPEKNETSIRYEYKDYARLFQKWKQSGLTKTSPDGQIEELFTREEQNKIWFLWALINARKPVPLKPEQVLNAATIAATFNAFSKTTSKNPMIYKKIMPVPKPKVTPPKKAA